MTYLDKDFVKTRMTVREGTFLVDDKVNDNFKNIFNLLFSPRGYIEVKNGQIPQTPIMMGIYAPTIRFDNYIDQDLLRKNYEKDFNLEDYYKIEVKNPPHIFMVAEGMEEYDMGRVEINIVRK